MDKKRVTHTYPPFETAMSDQAETSPHSIN